MARYKFLVSPDNFLNKTRFIEVFTIASVLFTAVLIGVEAANIDSWGRDEVLNLHLIVAVLLAIELTLRFISRSPLDILSIASLWNTIKGAISKFYISLSVYWRSDPNVRHSSPKVDAPKTHELEMTFLHRVFIVVDVMLLLLIVAEMFFPYLIEADQFSLARLARVVTIVRLIDVDWLRDFFTSIYHSFKSVVQAMIILAIHFFVFAVAGTFVFHNVSPKEFGNLWSTGTTLMRIQADGGYQGVVDNMQVLLSQKEDSLHVLSKRAATHLPFIDGKLNVEIKNLNASVNAHAWRVPAAALFFYAYVIIGVVLLVGIVTAMITNDIADHREQLRKT